jgi:sulfur carrier protein
MKIRMNGNEEVIEKDSISISELLKTKNVQMPETVSVELNGKILDREKFDSVVVEDGNEVEFLYFMGGGL